jgi:anti-sigma regulatory factor (Ser/Thr protein kinase)
MKLINWYTISLVILAFAALIYSISDIQWVDNNVFIVAVIIVIILEVLPLRLPSGDQYSAGSIGFLFLLLYSGFSHSILAIYLAAFAYYLKNIRRGAPHPIRLFVTIGMYSGSLLIASSAIHFIEWQHNYIEIAIAAITFEFANFLFIEGIEATVFGKRMFSHFKQKFIELIIPILISIFVLTMFTTHSGEIELIHLMIYTLFFLLIVIFFSNEYIKQLELRKATSNAFIQVMEGRIKSDLTGHGSRVAAICEVLLDDFAYPKRKRHDLIQAAIIHDIGKAILPSHIFRKKGALTLSEEREYKKHPEKAMEIVKTMFPKESFSKWILHHHERWDGDGFPSALAGADIPLGARILAIGNELEHLLQRHQDPDTVLNLINEKSGTVLDPKLVEKITLSHIEEMLISLEEELVREELTEVSETSEDIYHETDIYTQIGETFYLLVKNGVVFNKKGKPSHEFVQDLAETALKRKGAVLETCVHHQELYSLHALPVSSQDVVVFVHNITPYMDYRKTLEMNVLESYVNVINVFSQGKIKLLTSLDILQGQLGDLIGQMSIRSASDVPKSRAFMKEILEQYPVTISNMKVLVAVSEATSNIVKHASDGRFAIYQSSTKLQLLLSDRGSGIPLHEIPTAILIAGYSSKRSLGRGFNLIGNYSDGVQIYTTSEGTCILIEFQLQNDSTKQNGESVMGTRNH